MLCDPDTQEVAAGGSRVQGQPWRHMQFQANLGYRRPRLKRTNNPALLESEVQAEPLCTQPLSILLGT